MTVFLFSEGFWNSHGDAFQDCCREANLSADIVLLPADPDARLGEAARDRVEAAFYSADIFNGGLSRSFFSATQGAPNLSWLHVFNAGTDNPVFGRLLANGVRLTNSSGSSAGPIAQTAITGLLMLSRGFPHWLKSQKEHRWNAIPATAMPDDLGEQTLVVVGLGAIGSEIARLGQALGLRVVGVRRSPRREGDPVEEVVPPSELDGLLPEADWLVLACPLTDETKQLVDGDALSRLKRGARIINIARGEVIDEPALIDALRSGQVGGAYLDVFEEEPLPEASPLWDLPNVIVTPHNSSSSTGNAGRVLDCFFRNVRAWGKNEPLINEVV